MITSKKFTLMNIYIYIFKKYYRSYKHIFYTIVASLSYTFLQLNSINFYGASETLPPCLEGKAGKESKRGPELNIL